METGEDRSCCIGIDLCDDYAMVSYQKPDMEEPETVGTVAGSENYRIPAVLAKKKELGVWYYGDEAKRMAKGGEVACVDGLLRRAIAGEVIGIGGENYDAVELLALFLRRVMELPQKLDPTASPDRLVLTVAKLTQENMEVFWKVAAKLGFLAEQFTVIDHKESFYYFAYSQQEQLWVHDIFLFEYDDDELFFYDMRRDQRTRPQVISIRESPRYALNADKDTDFTGLVRRNFESRIISSVYLVGDGFDGGWMKNSLNFICRGRRAFLGKNLFSKGACYAASAARLRATDESNASPAADDDWPFIYMGENEMKFNLSLKVQKRGQMEFYSLITAGKNWFESQGECEVILSGTTGIDLWKQLPNSREAKIETLELTGLPRRPDRTTRIRITARPLSDERAEIEIKDLGFGDFFRATERTWKYTMTL
ncbi:MAG: DUF5716 family protein [Clostridiales bacterium]|nr:DUF5716 family protein [Clostridiales bacterium]